MISIFRNLVEREFSNHVCSGAIANDSVRLELHWSIIEKLSCARQDLSDQGDAVIGFHRFDFDVDIDISRAEQQLAWWCADTAYTGQQWLIEGIEHQSGNDLPETALFRLHYGLE